MSRMRVVSCVALALVGCAGAFADEAPDLSGAELYQTFCASCHGPSAQGNGPVASSLRSKVPDLTRIAARNDGGFPKKRVQRIIDGQTLTPAHGTREMPVWGWELYAAKGEDAARRKRVAELLASIIQHLESIQQR